jgi:hypothetical protein
VKSVLANVPSTFERVASEKNQVIRTQNPPFLTLVFAYYENPGMLQLQWREIASYPVHIKKAITVIVVDDASPLNPASTVSRPASLPTHSIFRLDRDIRWNQDAARNIGAHEATTPWLFLTDIDHVIPTATLEELLAMEKDPQVFYTFGRVKFANGEPRESHPNSYLMTRDLYWKIGGHDEDFAGIYGKDFLFRKRAHRVSSERHLSHLPIARVGSTMLSDAGTRTISRENTLRQRIWGYVLPVLKGLKLWRGVQTLTENYHRVV